MTKARKAIFIAAMAGGYSVKDSALAAGYAPSGAGSNGNKLLQKQDVKDALDQALIDRGLTVERCAEELDAGLRKKKYGSHDSYLDKLLKLRKLIAEDKTVTTNNFFGREAYAEFCEEFAKRNAIPGEAA